MKQKSEYIWLNGKFVAWNEANIHITTHAFNYGTGVFEGIRSYLDHDGRDSNIFRLTCHIKRLLNSAKIVGLENKYNLDEIEEIIKKLCVKNKITNGYIKPVLYFDEAVTTINPIGANTNLLVNCIPLDTRLTQTLPLIRVNISRLQKPNANSSFYLAKITGNYFCNSIAARQAKLAGFDDSILLDQNGFVAEATAANIFIYKDEQLITPALGACLPGLTRDSILSLGHKLNVPIIERLIHPEELYIADEVFMAGTAKEIMSIKQVDDVVIGNGMDYPITSKIADLLYKIMSNQTKDHKSWLSKCSV